MNLIKVFARLFQAAPAVQEPATPEPAAPSTPITLPNTKRQRGRTKRSIEAVDPTTGEIMFRFETITAAGREGFGYQGVYNVLNGTRKTYKGLIWRDHEVPGKEKPLKKPRRSIEAVDPNTGEVCQRFVGVKAAVAAGFRGSNIRQVLAGLQRTHRGLAWRYCESPISWTGPRLENPEVASVLLTDALRRDELARLRRDIFFDETRQEWGVRLKGRTLYRPQRHEVVQIWYDMPEEERLPGNQPTVATAAPATTRPRTTRPRVTPPPKATPVAVPKRQRLSQGKFSRIVAFDPETGQVAYIFQGIQDAVRRGFGQASVYSALNGTVKTYRGYAWRGDDTLRKPIEGRCPTTGTVLLRFQAVQEVRTKGYNLYSIQGAIKRGGTYRHLRWAYATATHNVATPQPCNS